MVKYSIQHIPAAYLDSPGAAQSRTNFDGHVKAHMIFSARCKPVTIINILATQKEVTVILLWSGVINILKVVKIAEAWKELYIEGL